MRKSKEMFELILEIARKDERIKAVYLNGSRTNPNVMPDIFQDYDIVYAVTETRSFREEDTWIQKFGDILYMQCPEAMDAEAGEVCDLDACYGYLIQLADGNRIDLHLQTVDYCEKHMREDKLTCILLDKEDVLPKIPEATDKDYWVKKPTEIQYRHCCNEFWWCLNNVAKGMWREEVLYVMDMLNGPIRPQLMKMLTWWVGIETDFSCSVGKSGKYIENYLPATWWQSYLKTYSCTEEGALWQAVFALCDLFEEVAKEVGSKLGFVYNQEEGSNSRFFLENAQQLPKDAKDVL